MDPTPEISESDRSALVEQWTPLAYAESRRFRTPYDSPYDLTQQALLGLTQAAHDFNPALGPFGPFAKLVVNRTLRRYCEKNGANPAHSTWIRIAASPDDFARAGPTEEEDATYRAGLVRMVTASLDALDTDDRELLTRHFGLDGEDPESYAAIGRSLGITGDTVRGRTNSALRRVRDDFRSKGWTLDTWALAIA